MSAHVYCRYVTSVRMRADHLYVSSRLTDRTCTCMAIAVHPYVSAALQSLLRLRRRLLVETHDPRSRSPATPELHGSSGSNALPFLSEPRHICNKHIAKQGTQSNWPPPSSHSLFIKDGDHPQSQRIVGNSWNLQKLVLIDAPTPVPIQLHKSFLQSLDLRTRDCARVGFAVEWAWCGKGAVRRTIGRAVSRQHLRRRCR